MTILNKKKKIAHFSQTTKLTYILNLNKHHVFRGLFFFLDGSVKLAEYVDGSLDPLLAATSA